MFPVDVAPPLRAVRRPPRHLGRGLLAVPVALVLTGAWLSGGGAGAGAITSTGVRTVVVAPGDSLWSIAATDYPGQDIRERVAEIIARNSLGSAPIQPGEVLHLPA